MLATIQIAARRGSSLGLYPVENKSDQGQPRGAISATHDVERAAPPARVAWTGLVGDPVALRPLSSPPTPP